jgi:transaldolase
MNPLLELSRLGQSLWLDSISRKILDGGELARLVREDGLAGVTSNPSIFEKAIGEGVEYRPKLAKLLAANPRATAMELYESLAIQDIRDATDVLRPVFDRTKGRDGFVSLEVTLEKGEDVASILEEARHLASAVARPNVLIKVPGTKDGVAAFQALTAEGINVNVTLLFSVATYAKVAEAFLAGLEARAKTAKDLSSAASVASFFVSRIDTAVDPELEAKKADALLGKVAIDNAKVAYAKYLELFSGPRWQALAAKGARTQRVLWASTSTKNKKYRDVLYVEELVGKDTVNTAPPATIDAFRDHGKPRLSIGEDLDGARKRLASLAGLGIDLEKVTDRLLDEGMASFSGAFEKLLATIESQRTSAATPVTTRSAEAARGRSNP